jgi:hypothetical protein
MSKETAEALVVDVFDFETFGPLEEGDDPDVSRAGSNRPVLATGTRSTPGRVSTHRRDVT